MPQRLTRFSRGSAVVLALLVTAALGGVAQAATPPASAEVEERIAELLAANPEATRLDATSVELEPGAVLTIPDPGGAAAVVTSACLYYYLCMWENVYRGGERLALTDCGLYTLSRWNVRPGNDWRDDISSVWNNQTPGTVSSFYDWRGVGYRRVLSLSAGNYLQDMTRDAAIGGGNLNDRIDQVYVC